MNLPFDLARPVLALAPMAGFTDSVYRPFCRDMGADLLYTEMVSAKGLLYDNANTNALLRVDPAEGRVIAQLFGHEPGILADAARLILDTLEERCAGIDINMGCPAPKIFNNGDGSALMKEPSLAGKIVSAVAGAVSCPVSVKFRAGVDPEHINAVSFAKVLEENGAAFLAFHGRTRTQMYAGKADRELIRKVRESVRVPVLANGDICSGPDSLSMLELTDCAGLMVGRAALGNPFIFREIASALSGKECFPAAREERFLMAVRHTERMFACKGERGIVELRKHLAFYASGFPGASSLRVALQQAKTPADVRKILDI